MEKLYRLLESPRWGNPDLKTARPRISDEEIHAGVSKIIKTPRAGNAPALHIEPKTMKGELSPDEERLKELYELAKYRTVGGKKYFGYGSLAKYLRERHGIDLLNEKIWPDERIMRNIALHLEKGVNCGSGGWRVDFEHPQVGRNRGSLFSIAKTRGFFGHGSWRELVKDIIERYEIDYPKKKLKRAWANNRPR